MWGFHQGKGGYTLILLFERATWMQDTFTFFSLYNEESIGFASEIMKFEVPEH